MATEPRWWHFVTNDEPVTQKERELLNSLPLYLRRVREHGWGRVEVVIQDGVILAITETQQHR
jgi:hypothetical protein